MTLIDSLKGALSELAIVRAAAASLNAAMHDRKAAWNLENAELLNAINDHGQRLEQADKQVRALALAAYELDKSNKKPVEGVGIQESTVYTYIVAEAIAWAKVSMPSLVSEVLDEKALVKIAKATPLPFATGRPEVKATIASDLSAYVAIPEPVSSNE